ncbi:UAA transporter [Tulasnella sp. UAMH 9824]|nr:UAA transporter [Tulasnella sp. UAMH 9824]
MLNVAVSNLSLKLVRVPLQASHSRLRSLFTVLVAYILSAPRGKGTLGAGATKLLFVNIAGVGFAMYDDYSFTAWGFVLTLLGGFLAAL